MYRKDKDTRLKKTYEAYVGRLNPDERKIYDAFYEPLIEEFYKKNPQGKDLAEWKYQRYMRDYAKVVKSLDDNVGRVLDYLKEKVCWTIRWWSILPIRVSIWVSMAGSTSDSCMRSPCIRR